MCVIVRTDGDPFLPSPISCLCPNLSHGLCHLLVALVSTDDALVALVSTDDVLVALVSTYDTADDVPRVKLLGPPPASQPGTAHKP